MLSCDGLQWLMKSLQKEGGARLVGCGALQTIRVDVGGHKLQSFFLFHALQVR